MEKKPLRETFAFLLSESRFTECVEEEGPGYRQAYFHSPKIVLRIAEQNEMTPIGIYVSYLTFLIDPKNSRRWCMFEKAVQVTLGQKIEGSANVQQLEHNLREYIDPIFTSLTRGTNPPFQDFS